ncbi:MAG: glycosyltransferase 87 family protein [Candidatus Tumulicola sp.]
MSAPGRWPLAFAFALIALALLAARPAPTPGPFLRDFEAYWSAGATWNAGADPYRRAIWNAERAVTGVDATRDELLPFVGPPATLLAWGAIARLPYGSAARLWCALLVLAMLALAVVAIRGSTGAMRWRSFFAAVALAIAFGPVTSDLALGQVALIAFLAASVVALHPPRTPAAAVAAFVAFFQPNVALGLVSQIGRNRATFAMALAGTAAYAAGALAIGWNWPLAYASHLRLHDTVERFSAIQLTPAAIAHGFGATPEIATLVASIAAVVAIVAAVFMWPRITGSFARFAAFAPLAPFVAGFFHEHDLLVAYVAAVWCAFRAHGTARRLALAGTLLVAADWLGMAQRPSGIVQSALLASAAASAFVALGEESDWRSTTATLVPVATIFALAAWLGAGHPSPVWPDALGGFHAARSASVAAVWHAEQLRAGLLIANPTWAFLRALSLLGCALLSLAVVLGQRSQGVGATAER